MNRAYRNIFWARELSEVGNIHPRNEQHSILHPSEMNTRKDNQGPTTVGLILGQINKQIYGNSFSFGTDTNE